MPCKHMYLVPRKYNGLEISYSNEPEPPQDPDEAIIENDLGPPLESLLSPHVRLQLQAMRAENQEAQKRAREAETEKAFQECERELEDALKKLGVIVCDKKKRQCTLQYFQSAVAGLKNTMLDVQGVNAVGAGRKCQ